MTPLGYSSSIKMSNSPSVVTEKELAERHIAIVKRLTDAAFDYLTFDDQVVMDEPSIPTQPRVGMESLIHAVRQRDTVQSQIEQIEAAISAAPEPIATVMKIALLPPLRAQLESMNEWVTTVQKELENQES